LITLLRESSWLYPLVEVTHILGFIVLAGAAILFDLRVLGLSSLRAGGVARVAIRPLGLHLLPWSVLAALLMVVPSGVLLLIVNLDALIDNRAFILKLLLLACAAGNAVAFHLGTGRDWANWSAGDPVPRAARLHAATSLALWVMVVACGRMIAYV